MNTTVLSKSRVLRRSRNFHWPLTFFLGGFAALVLGLVAGVGVVAGAGFVSMVVSLVSMKESLSAKFSVRLCPRQGKPPGE